MMGNTLKDIPREGSQNRRVYDLLVANPTETFSRADVAAMLEPDIDIESDDGYRRTKQYGQSLAQLYAAELVPIIRVSHGRYQFDPNYIPPNGTQPAIKPTAIPEWRSVPMQQGEIAQRNIEELIKGDILGQSKGGNWIIRDEEDRIWEVRVIIEGRRM